MMITIEIDGKPHVLELSEEDAAALRFIAELNKTNVETALVQAIRDEKLIGEEERSGGTLLVERNKKLRTLTRRPSFA